MEQIGGGWGVVVLADVTNPLFENMSRIIHQIVDFSYHKFSQLAHLEENIICKCATSQETFNWRF